MKNINKKVPEHIYDILRKYAYDKKLTMKQALIDAIQLLKKQH